MRIKLILALTFSLAVSACADTGNKSPCASNSLTKWRKQITSKSAYSPLVFAVSTQNGIVTDNGCDWVSF